jgi:DNA repair ATPase RecN
MAGEIMKFRSMMRACFSSLQHQMFNKNQLQQNVDEIEKVIKDAHSTRDARNAAAASLHSTIGAI